MFLHRILERRTGPALSIDPGRLREAPPPRPFRAALESGPVPRIISEIKRCSPSKGPLRPDLDPGQMARWYQSGGACALSVLTEPNFFKGHLDDLKAARGACDLPVLRKDFLQHPWEVDEARLAGADAVLLIVAILDDVALRSLRERAEELGMQALVEVHTEPELERALASGAGIIGINNRNLVTFEVDLTVSHRLAAQIPDGHLKVAESGFATARDLAGFPEIDAFLIGESLVVSEDPEGTLRRLRSPQE